MEKTLNSVHRLIVLCRCSAANSDDAVVGLAATRWLKADWTDRHNTAGVAGRCLLFTGTVEVSALSPHRACLGRLRASALPRMCSSQEVRRRATDRGEPGGGYFNGSHGVEDRVLFDRVRRPAARERSFSETSSRDDEGAGRESRFLMFGPRCSIVPLAFSF
jgi:hypothetical protein